MVNSKKVVVVGGGPSGRMVVKQLKGKNLHVTLVQAAKTEEFALYFTEVLTGMKGYDQVSTSQPLSLADEIVYGVATGVGDGKVAIKTNEGTIQILDFDYLVCATGMSIPTITAEPGQDVQQRREEVTRLSKVLSDPTKEVVVAGGGAIGVELVGDILDAGCEKVTLITPGDRLLLEQDPKWSVKVVKQLESRGAKVMFGVRSTSPQEYRIAGPGRKVQVETTTGNTLECDVYLPAYGRGARTEWLTRAADGATLPSGVLDDKGRVQVDEYLASKAYPKLYAIAACSDLPEPPLVVNYETQAQCIAKNIVKAESAKYGGGGLTKPMIQMVGHKTYGFLATDAMPAAPSCVMHCCLVVCGFPLNLLCPCVWCGVACGPLDTHTCGYCCSDAEGAGVARTIANTAKAGVMADMCAFEGLGAKVAPEAMKR